MKREINYLKGIFIYLYCSSIISCTNDDIDVNIDHNNQNDIIAYAYYGDYDSNRVFKFPITEDTFGDGIEEIITGDGPYPVDIYNRGNILSITRKEKSVTSYNPVTKEIINIPLAHKPRSSAYNSKNGLTLISGGDKSMTSIMSGSTVLLTVGDTFVINEIEDYGGNLATGHPKWIDDFHFFHIDRFNKKVHIYNIYGSIINSFNIPTSAHHIEVFEDFFYIICEGNSTKKIAPSIIKFSLDDQYNFHQKTVFHFPINDIEFGGAHHMDIHPLKRQLYVGLSNGQYFIIDCDSMKLIKKIKAGLGAGHTGLPKKGTIAFIINHNDNYVTALNLDTLEVIKNIPITSTILQDNSKLIGHTFSFNTKETKFYLAASRDGTIIEIDVNKLEVSSKLEFKDAYLLQGTFMFNDPNLNPNM